MTAHAILDIPTGPRHRFLLGIDGAAHISLAAVMLLYGVLDATRKPTMGDKEGGRMGAVAVTPVHSIPLPSRSSAPNPVANPTESQVPTPPPKAKPIPKEKAPDPQAIPIKSKTAPKKPQPIGGRGSPTSSATQQRDLPNQVYTHKRPGAQLAHGSNAGRGGRRHRQRFAAGATIRRVCQTDHRSSGAALADHQSQPSHSNRAPGGGYFHDQSRRLRATKFH